MSARLLLALLAIAALLAAGCGESKGDGTGRDDGGDGDEPTAQTTDEQAPTRTVERTTRVEVLKQAEGGRFDPRAIFDRAGPGVVEVISLFGEASDPSESGGIGSGFVVSEQGEIITNAHVVTSGEGAKIKRATEVYVQFSDDNQVSAKVVGFDPNADVALLKLDTLSGLTLRPIPLGEGNDVRVGAPVVAIGSPFGEEQSLSVGVVSATDRAIDSLTGFDTLGAVQTDAAINQGNSGGPLINARGEVIGINAQIRTTSGENAGVGYAIPVDQIKRSIAQLREDGEVRYAYLGVSTTPVYPQLADRFDLGGEDGAWVQEVVPDGPADKADIKAGNGNERFQARPFAPGGDVITKVDSIAVHTENDLGIALTRFEPGDTVELEVVRDGERRTIEVELGERPAQAKSG